MGVKVGLEQHGELFKGSAKGSVQAALNKTKLYGLGLIQASTPVDTGEAKAGWSVVQQGNGLTWRNPVEHSRYLEFGTKRMRARPMLAPNLPKIRDYFRKELVKSIGRTAASNVVSSNQSSVSFDSATSGFRKSAGKRKSRK